MDYLLHCCECESWNQTKNRRERDRDEYISLLFLCLADCTMYVYMEYVCFFLPASQYLLRGYSMVLQSTKRVSWGLDAPPFCVYKKYISIKGNIGRGLLYSHMIMETFYYAQFVHTYIFENASCKIQPESYFPKIDCTVLYKN